MTMMMRMMMMMMKMTSRLPVVRGSECIYLARGLIIYRVTQVEEAAALVQAAVARGGVFVYTGAGISTTAGEEYKSSDLVPHTKAVSSRASVLVPHTKAVRRWWRRTVQVSIAHRVSWCRIQRLCAGSREGQSLSTRAPGVPTTAGQREGSLERLVHGLVTVFHPL
jgi:hypothetical protein